MWVCDGDRFKILVTGSLCCWLFSIILATFSIMLVYFSILSVIFLNDSPEMWHESRFSEILFDHFPFRLITNKTLEKNFLKHCFWSGIWSTASNYVNSSIIHVLIAYAMVFAGRMFTKIQLIFSPILNLIHNRFKMHRDQIWLQLY